MQWVRDEECVSVREGAGLRFPLSRGCHMMNHASATPALYGKSAAMNKPPLQQSRLGMSVELATKLSSWQMLLPLSQSKRVTFVLGP